MKLDVVIENEKLKEKNKNLNYENVLIKARIKTLVKQNKTLNEEVEKLRTKIKNISVEVNR